MDHHLKMRRRKINSKNHFITSWMLLNFSDANLEETTNKLNQKKRKKIRLTRHTKIIIISTDFCHKKKWKERVNRKSVVVKWTFTFFLGIFLLLLWNSPYANCLSDRRNIPFKCCTRVNLKIHLIVCSFVRERNFFLLFSWFVLKVSFLPFHSYFLA